MLSHINKNNLHHAYLLEGGEEIIPKLFLYLENELNFHLNGNPDLYFKKYDTFKIEDARVLNQIKDEKSLSGKEKIIIIKTNSFLREAQNALLKMFEEPIENTYFFIIVRDKNTLLSTFLSRFYFIPNSTKVLNFEREVIKFLKMNLKERIDFIKDFTAKEDEDEENYVAPRHKALEFLDTLESKLSESKNKNPKTLEQIFTTRSFLRDHSSSAKTLLEALALNI
ncbi:MAG: hypothetical protein KBD14_01470 [Candidatus Pacebacteria bacterium]|nr:hypothetical protein [Candidatus Paceibacterota bacterium]